MKKAILGKKIGMTQIFVADGRLVPVTVVEAGPCKVTQVKTAQTELMTAAQKIGQVLYAQQGAEGAAAGADGAGASAGSASGSDDDTVEAEVVDDDDDKDNK